MVEKKCFAMFCQNCQFFGCTPRLNMKDKVDQKLLKFLHKLITNKLPAYFNSYKPYLKRIDRYNWN